ncbi:hypothetical protein OQA88_13076 [Cercophora sp. LCS_1]
MAWPEDGTSDVFLDVDVVATCDPCDCVSKFSTKFGRQYLYDPDDESSTGYCCPLADAGAQYLCPSDEKERDRLDMQHHVFGLLFQKRLYFSPLPETEDLKILDVCTGTGIWAIDVGDAHPRWTVKGVDLSPQQPESVPPNVYFELDDVNFQAELVRQAFDALRPGGWLESQEIASLVECDDNTLERNGTLTYWVRLVAEAGLKVGRPRDVARSMVQWYRDVGFVDVKIMEFKVPIGSWAKDPALKEMGAYWRENMVEAVESLSLRLFNEGLGWTYEELQV